LKIEDWNGGRLANEAKNSANQSLILNFQFQENPMSELENRLNAIVERVDAIRGRL